MNPYSFPHVKNPIHIKSPQPFGVGVFGVYLEIGQQSMLQPIHFWEDLFEIYPKMYVL